MREAHGNKRQTQSKTKTHLLREKLKGQFQMTNMKKTMNYRETDRQTDERIKSSSDHEECLV